MKRIPRAAGIALTLLSSWWVLRCGSEANTQTSNDGSATSEAGSSEDAATIFRSCGSWKGSFVPGNFVSGWRDMVIVDGRAVLVTRSDGPELFGATSVSATDKDGLLVEFGLSPLEPIAAMISGRAGEDEFEAVAVHTSGDRIVAGYQTESTDAGNGLPWLTLERRSVAGAVSWRKAWDNVGSVERMLPLPNGDILFAGSQGNPRARKFDTITTAPESVWVVRVAGDTGAVIWATSFGSSGNASVFLLSISANGEIAVAAQTRTSGSFIGDMTVARLSQETGAILGKQFVDGTGDGIQPGLVPRGGFAYGAESFVVAGSLHGTLGNPDALVDSGAKEIKALAAGYSIVDAGLQWQVLTSMGKSSGSHAAYHHVVHKEKEGLFLACSSSLQCEERLTATGALVRSFSFPKADEVDRLVYHAGKYFVASTSIESESDGAGVQRTGRRHALYCFEE